MRANPLGRWSAIRTRSGLAVQSPVSPFHINLTAFAANENVLYHSLHRLASARGFGATCLNALKCDDFRMARDPRADNRSLKRRLQFNRRRHFRVTALYADHADAGRAVQLSPDLMDIELR